MRAVYTLTVRRFVAGGPDAHGNAAPGFYAPEPLAVLWIAPTGSQEPGEDREAVTSGLTLGLPPGAVLGSQDVVEIDGETWEIDGDAADWSRGPFGFRAGLTVNLKKTEG